VKENNKAIKVIMADNFSRIVEKHQIVYIKYPKDIRLRNNSFSKNHMPGHINFKIP
jgi:hypothetical protein